MGVVLAERHRALADEPGAELLVRPHEAVRPHREEDRPQPVEHLVGTLGLRRDLRVQPDRAHRGARSRRARASRLRSSSLPGTNVQPSVGPREAVADEVLDSVELSECHRAQSQRALDQSSAADVVALSSRVSDDRCAISHDLPLIDAESRTAQLERCAASRDDRDGFASQTS